MELANALRQKIIKLASKKDITIHKLTMDSGISYSTISSFLTGKSNSLTISTILHLCEGAGITLEEFFSDPIFKDVTIKHKEKIYKL